MSGVNADDLRRAYSHLQRGQSIDEVLAILGPPTRRRPMIPKRWNPAPDGTSLEYVVHAHDPLTPNVHDVVLTLTFDTESRLVAAYPQNIDGLAPLQ